jgi:hypothetical protein
MKTLLTILTVLGAIVGFGFLTIMLVHPENPTHLEKLVPLIALGVSLMSAYILLDTAATEITEYLSTEKSLRRKLDDRLVEIIDLQRVIKELKVERLQTRNANLEWDKNASRLAITPLDPREGTVSSYISVNSKTELDVTQP